MPFTLSRNKLDLCLPLAHGEESMKKFFSEAERLGYNLTPWNWKDAWYISPDGSIIGSITITIPVCLLGFIAEWIGWQWRRHHPHPVDFPARHINYYKSVTRNASH